MSIFKTIKNYCKEQETCAKCRLNNLEVIGCPVMHSPKTWSETTIKALENFQERKNQNGLQEEKNK